MQTENSRPSNLQHKKARQSLALARAYLDEARQSGAIGTTRLAMNGLYFAWFHAGRSILFRDGIREKSHYCLEQYLSTYVSSGKLDTRWLSLFGRMRKKREESQYSFSPAPLSDEINTVLDLTEQFIDLMENLDQKDSSRKNLQEVLKSSRPGR